MRTILIVSFFIALAWTLHLVRVAEGGRTMLANGGIITVVTEDGTIKTCTQIGSGPNSIIICN